MASTKAARRPLRDADRTLLLVVPPQRGLLEGFSTGLIAIANYVRQHDQATEVRLLDFGPLNQEELPERASEALLAARGTVFVGITGTTASYQSMLATARAFKQMQPSCVVVLGGHHVSPQDDVVITHHRDIVDFVIRGEGEIALTDLLTSYPNVGSVPNLSFLEQGKFRRNPDGPMLAEADLDNLSPAFDDEGLRSAAGKFNHATYVSARGCPLTCAFCAVRSTAIRAKSIPAIIRDLSYLVGTLGYTELAIEDNFFAHQPKRTLALCGAIETLRKELAFSWDCQTRVESMRRGDVVQAMSRAGCTAAYLGVEALVPKHLRYLNKTSQPERYLTALEKEVLPLMHDAEIDAYLNIQLGIPGETEADRAQTISLLARFGELALARGREITIFPQLNVVYPGTPHFEMLVKKGYFGPPGRNVFEQFTAWEADEEPIFQFLGEHFAHGVGGIPLGILDLAKLAAGCFAVSAAALSIVATQLRRMDTIRAVRVFRYGEYLAREQPLVIANA